MNAPVTEIEFYWRPGCGFCMALQRPLERSGLPVRAVNIWEDPDAAARVRSVADGNEIVPTVFVGDRALINPQFSEIEDAVREQAPDLLATAQEATAANAADDTGTGKSRWQFWR
ncbi:glutaredoxin domain-containing protein [Amycolatopsis antarctica]|uniref:glutaredoxin domain-containing protein n=1 Tax=Amycolatopsis antarctica TaxID=1854586 RepID=UPI0023E78244|nr:glutaredoxin domain-containing protein [Amycolatopsis antarctica]